jgi:hypothetical protein
MPRPSSFSRLVGSAAGTLNFQDLAEKLSMPIGDVMLQCNGMFRHAERS